MFVCYCLYVNVHGNAQVVMSQYLAEMILQLEFLILRTSVVRRWSKPATVCLKVVKTCNSVPEGG